MSIRKRVTAGRLGDGTYHPRLVLVVDGAWDVYRVARQLEARRGPVGAVGRRILRSMDEQEPNIVAELRKQLGPVVVGDGGYRGRRARQPQLRLGMSADELRQLEEQVR